jgi:hypothetical protein
MKNPGSSLRGFTVPGSYLLPRWGSIPGEEAVNN